MQEFKRSNNSQHSSRGLKIVLYCRTSGRAALAACALKDMEYLDLLSIQGGFGAWAAAGNPVI